MASIRPPFSPEAPPSPLSSRPGESRAFGPPRAKKNGSCSATTVVQRLLLLEAPPSPLSSRPGGGMGLRPPQGEEKRVLFSNSCCSATTVAGSAALPFVISTGAQRSGEICGVSGPFLEMFFEGARRGGDLC